MGEAMRAGERSQEGRRLRLLGGMHIPDARRAIRMARRACLGVGRGGQPGHVLYLRDRACKLTLIHQLIRASWKLQLYV